MISVVLATHNEEKNIERCLKAVKSFADEIIVVDGESSDKTVALAKELGAKVIETTNKLVFHINKQMAMDKAKGDLVLQLDADEVVDEELARFIQRLENERKNDLKSEHTEINGWWIRRKNWFFGKFLTKGGQYPDPTIRLYRKDKARLPQKDVHEQMEVDGPVGTAEGHLLHYGNPSFAEYMRKFNTYTTLKAHQLREDGVKVSFVNSLIYLFWKPPLTFLSLYIRHKGILDGLPGLIFAWWSGFYYCITYLKIWEIEQQTKLGLPTVDDKYGS